MNKSKPAQSQYNSSRVTSIVSPPFSRGLLIYSYHAPGQFFFRLAASENLEIASLFLRLSFLPSEKISCPDGALIKSAAPPKREFQIQRYPKIGRLPRRSAPSNDVLIQSFRILTLRPLRLFKNWCFVKEKSFCR